MGCKARTGGRVLLLALAAGAMGPAAANLDVAPTRLFLEADERAARLVVVNRGERAHSFRVSVYDVREQADGERELLREPREGFPHAAGMLRYAPRQMRLEPGERQTVRFLARRPPSLPEGEYRARVAVRTLPPAQPPSHPASGEEEGEVAIRILPLQAVTLPIAVLHGSPGVEVTVAEARATAEGLAVRVEREGRRSFYGRLRLYRGSEATGEPLAERRAVAVVPLEERVFRFPDVAVPEGERLHVVYEALEEDSSDYRIEQTLIVR